MPVQTRTIVDFDELQHRAAELLETYHVPPQRYGTAFHLTVPIQDVREMNIETVGATEENIEIRFNALDEQYKQYIFSTLDSHDPYLLWQVANIHSFPVRVIHVEAGQSVSFQLDQPELTWVFLEKDAQLTVESFVMDTKLALARMFVWQGEGSRFEYWGLRAGNDFLTERLQVNLVGQGATARATHLTFGGDRKQSDLQVSAYHVAPKTESFLAVRTAAADKHVSVYRGLIDIDEAAKGSVGYQQGRALLLSRGAVVDNLPELAIRTNDVRCSHGVNTTHIDDSALFYMRSRGLDKAQARQLAITGFYHDTMDIPAQTTEQLSSILDAFHE